MAGPSLLKAVKVVAVYVVDTAPHLQAKDERGIDISASISQASSVLNVDHPAGTVHTTIPT
jgi:hypothetical protein